MTAIPQLPGYPFVVHALVSGSAIAAAEVRLARRPARTMLLFVCVGVGITWTGILLSFLRPGRQPSVRFVVSALAAGV